MEMCYSGALVMPSSCAVMSEDEMTYVEGGISGVVRVKRSFLSKSACYKEAAKYAGKTIDGIGKKYGRTRIAAEIYAHTYAFFCGVGAMASMFGVKKLTGFSSKTINQALSYIVSHANPVNIGGDNAVRVAIYMAMYI